MRGVTGPERGMLYNTPQSELRIPHSGSSILPLAKERSAHWKTELCDKPEPSGEFQI